MSQRATPTGIERYFAVHDIIVSKTDLSGRITYANRVFMDVAGYTEAEILGAPHSLVRHPAMPRCVFKLLWDRIASGAEVFAYVVNMAKCGDHYWVLAHVTPTFGADGAIVGYHSNRRVPGRKAVKAVGDLYAQLLAAESRQSSKAAAIEASLGLLTGTLAGLGMDYDQFVWSLINAEAEAA